MGQFKLRLSLAVFIGCLNDLATIHTSTLKPCFNVLIEGSSKLKSAKNVAVKDRRSKKEALKSLLMQNVENKKS